MIPVSKKEKLSKKRALDDISSFLAGSGLLILVEQLRFLLRFITLHSTNLVRPIGKEKRTDEC